MRNEDVLLSRIELILKNRGEYEKLLEQRGDLAQSLLDLFQAVRAGSHIACEQFGLSPV